MRAVDGKVVVPRFHLDMRLSLKLLEVVPQVGDDLVFLFQGFSLQDWLSLGLGKIILTQPGDLMQRASSTWLDAIALG